MALSSAFIEAHITQWEAALNTPFRSYRAKWPSRLFHHSPIENVVQILTDGHLRSRDDPLNRRPKDVAAAGVIDNRLHAHASARIYFRPRNPTQWNIEGIRKAGECKFGEQSHAPVLVMLVFEAKAVLVREDVSFCDRNMQRGSAEPGNTPEYFAGIPFQKVFHEGGIGGDHSITDHKCAEVLVPSPLPLEGALQWIYCRSSAERDTLIHLLGAHAHKWIDQTRVSTDLIVFQREYAFVVDVTLAENGVVFELNPRLDKKPLKIRVRAWDSNDRQMFDYQHGSMEAVPASARRWRHEHPFPDGSYLVQIDLEDHMAFKAILSRGNQPF